MSTLPGALAEDDAPDLEALSDAQLLARWDEASSELKRRGLFRDHAS
jgi:hypothetical protein